MLSITYEEKSKGKEVEIESDEDCSVTSNRMDVKKLQDAEVFTYNGFMLPTKKNFSYITGSDALLQRKTIFQITSGSEAPDELLAVTNHGIDAGDVKKLQDAGIFTCNGLMMHTKKNFGYITGSDALLKRKTIFQITSGSEAPDELLAVTNHGIDAGDVKKLQDAGIFTCNGLMMHTKKNFGYITGSDALLKRKTVVLITTGSQALDELLAGGIETMAITEAFGEFRCGKTPLAHTLCVTTQLPISMKGVSVKVAYIETTGNFKGSAEQPCYLLRGRMKQYIIATNSTFIGDINSVDDYDCVCSGFAAKPVIIREEPTRVVWYKEPLEVKSREDMLHFATNLTFDRLYQIFGELVHKEEGPGFVEANREKDEAEALASFVRYYLEDRPVNLQELSDDLVQIFFDSEAGGLHQFLRPEEIGDENISHLMNSVTTFYARPPSDRWYSQIWE